MPEPGTASTPKRLPVCTIGGFLGAGKTTLINHLLRNAEGERLAVFVNDFGALDIDYGLVETVASDRISLANGCVCCTLNDDLVKAVAALARAPSPPDAVVIEASGVADPRAIDSSLAVLEHAGLVRRDVRLYLLDASNFAQLDYVDREDILCHAAASDLVVLNKTDLATAQQLDQLSTMLAECAPYSAMTTATQARVDRDLVLGPAARRSRPRAPATTTASHAAARYHHWHFESPYALDRARFEALLAWLPEVCFRVKGIIRFTDDPGSPYVLHVVGFHASLEPADARVPLAAEPGTRVVAIGKLDEDNQVRLERAFHAALARDTKAAGVREAGAAWRQ